MTDDVVSIDGWRERSRAPAAMPEHLTDLGNGELFAHIHRGAFLYVVELRRWLRWDGRIWATATVGEMRRAARTVTRGMYKAAAGIVDDDARKRAVSHASGTERLARLTAMIDFASSMEVMEKPLVEFDRDPYALTVANGTIDLRTGELRPHRREDLITRGVDIAYDDAAEAPRWCQFMSEWTGDDAELSTFFQRAAGYSLTGDTGAEVVFFLYGCGANGKSTAVNVLRALAGDHAMAAPFGLFACTSGPKRDTGAASPEVAMLRNARLVAATESEDGARLSESLVKAMTGSDQIVARHLYSEAFAFMPAFKVWLSTNHKPIIRGTDDGIWRRIKLVPFVVSFRDRMDPTLADVLRAELPGILRWAVDGARAWWADGGGLRGLGTCGAVDGATSEYRDESDVLGDFLADECAVLPEATVRARSLYARYKAWAEEAGLSPLSEKRFAGAMQERGVTRDRTASGMVYRGLGLQREGE